jgi:predicted hydrocarbon binding protein
MEVNDMSLKGKLPNQILNLALTTLDEIIGLNGTKSLLNYIDLKKFIDNYPPYNLNPEQNSEDFSRLLTGIIEIMGLKGARPILFRGGTRAFEVMRENYPALWNLEHVQPSEKTPERLFDEFVRIQEIIVNASSQIFGDIYKLYKSGNSLVLENHDCYWCKGLESTEPICFGSCGFNFAIAKWVVGQDVKVEETQCHAMGAPFCKFIMYRP